MTVEQVLEYINSNSRMNYECINTNDFICINKKELMNEDNISELLEEISYENFSRDIYIIETQQIINSESFYDDYYKEVFTRSSILREEIREKQEYMDNIFNQILDLNK